MFVKPKNSKKIVKPALILIVALTLGLTSSVVAATPGNSNTSPEIEVRVKPSITIDQQEFRDLNGNGSLDAYEDWRLPTNERVTDLIEQMTVEEKAGLMLISSLNNNSSRISLTEDHLRYFIIRDDPEPRDLAIRNNEFQELGEASRLGIPVIMTSNPRNHVNPNATFGHSEAGGQLSTWPGELGLAATQDPELVKEFAEIAANEWRAAGMHKIYGYMADLLTEPRWTRTDGTFGEDPELVSNMITSIVEGFQGEELNENSVSLTIKHFAGGGPRLEGTDPHHEWGKTNEYPTEGSLYQYHLPPFEAAIEAGTTSIMPYYAMPVNEPSAVQLPEHLWFSDDQQFEEVAFAYNEGMLQGLLRDELGFNGYVNSDTGIISERIWGVEDLTEPERYAKAINAGTALFSGGSDVAPLIEAINTGLVDESEIDNSISPLLTEMYDLGLFENPYVDPELAQQIGDDPESQAIADKAHRKSIVLLRNDNDASGQVLPITDDEVENVKLYVEVFQKGEERSAEASEDLADSIALADPSIEIVHSPEEATHAYIYVIPSLSWREDDTLGDPPSVELNMDSDTQIDSERILYLQEQVDTTILGVNMTNPWLINEIEPGADAVLATFNTTPDAIVDVIRGKFNPTGKLPFTVPADVEAVINNASDVPGYAETFEYAYTNVKGDDYSLGYGLSYISAEYMKNLVEQYEIDGEFQNDQAARSLKTHLTAVSLYENQQASEKVVKHMETFKYLLNSQQKNGLISDKAFDILSNQSDQLIKLWQ
ncbi:glycoside hydrolase family 3 protein [Oceanobacillus polygoni]|uniref:beta-glucosidase n=1 Tax=Oceanobacillus polygoni TaxID=1235259 RepID=A0A9X1CE39_9BACI|nr:glycoside hydrolase family 3 N-terminal domain-containing protein [Oceanobacillus polygoni]MBP2076795.1 beta-glucosidase [Oceanobacillus polygoni]